MVSPCRKTWLLGQSRSVLHLGCLPEAGASCPTCGARAESPGFAGRTEAMRGEAGGDALCARVEEAIRRLVHHDLERQNERVLESNARLLKAQVVGYVLTAAILSALFAALGLPWP